MRIVLATPAVVGVTQIFDETFRRLQSYPVPPYAIWTATWHIRAQPMGYYSGESTSVETHRYAVRLSDRNGEHQRPEHRRQAAAGAYRARVSRTLCLARAFIGPRRAARQRGRDGSGYRGAQDDRARHRHSPSLRIRFASRRTARCRSKRSTGAKRTISSCIPPIAPEVHNLRDLWIDVSTYDLLKVHLRRHLPSGPEGPAEPDRRDRLFPRACSARGSSRVRSGTTTMRRFAINTTCRTTRSACRHASGLALRPGRVRPAPARRRCGLSRPVLEQLRKGGPATP